MPTITQGQIHVFTFKDGLLARLAHDLRLGLDRFSLSVEGTKVTGQFWPTSLQVHGTIDHGRLNEDGINAKDKQKIAKTIQKEILKTSNHPQVSFEGQGQLIKEGTYEVQGKLTLLGRSAPLTLKVQEKDGQYTGEADFTPSQWGIKPYKALAGAIKLQDRLRISFSLPTS